MNILQTPVLVPVVVLINTQLTEHIKLKFVPKRARNLDITNESNKIEDRENYLRKTITTHLSIER